MRLRDIIFLLMFIASLGAVFYFLGNSITGYAMHEEYCENNVCKEFCKSNFDCVEKNEICCKKTNFAVCELSSMCKDEYEFAFKVEDKIINIESIDQIKQSDIALAFIGISILFLGFLYTVGKSYF